MSEKTPKLKIEGLTSHTDSEREYLDQQKRKSGWSDDFETKPEWPDRRERLVAKIADKDVIDFFGSLMYKITAYGKKNRWSTEQ